MKQTIENLLVKEAYKRINENATVSSDYKVSEFGKGGHSVTLTENCLFVWSVEFGKPRMIDT